jgi:hypothetical protein
MSPSRPGHFTSGERVPGAHWIGGWMDPRAGLDNVEKRKLLNLPGLKLRPLGRPARSQSLYRLHYPTLLKIIIGSFLGCTRSCITIGEDCGSSGLCVIVKQLLGLACTLSDCQWSTEQ